MKKIKSDELFRFWNSLSMTQKLSLLESTNIKNVDFWHVGNNRFISMSINNCSNIGFHQLRPEQQSKILIHINKTPEDYPTGEPFVQDELEFGDDDDDDDDDP